MSTTIRALREDDFEEHAELVYLSYTHGRDVEEGSMLAHRDWWLRGIERDPSYVPEQTRVMEVDGALVASVTCYHRPSYVIGREVKAACIGSVCTHPDHRRKGYVREVLAEAVEWMTAEGYEWSFLYGLAEVYGGSGWLNLATWNTTADLRLRDGAGEGLSDRRADRDTDAPLLTDLHARFNRNLTGPTVRGEEYWRRVLAPKTGGEPPEFRIVEDGGEPVGYYSLDGRAVREIAWIARPREVLAHVMRQAGGERVSFGFSTLELLGLLRDISAIPEQQQCREGQRGGVTLTEAYRGLWRLNGGDFCAAHDIADTEALLRLLRENDYVMWPSDRA